MLQDIEEIRVVSQAEDAYQAMEHFMWLDEHNFRPDAVILDIQLTHGNGIGVLRFIKKNFSGTKVIMLTNYASPEYWSRCMAEGADFFFDKSSDFMKVRDVMRELADN